jgi:hypothetical protein
MISTIPQAAQPPTGGSKLDGPAARSQIAAKNDGGN